MFGTMGNYSKRATIAESFAALKVGPKVVFNITPHCPRPGVSYGPENTKTITVVSHVKYVLVFALVAAAKMEADDVSSWGR